MGTQHPLDTGPVIWLAAIRNLESNARAVNLEEANRALGIDRRKARHVRGYFTTPPGDLTGNCLEALVSPCSRSTPAAKRFADFGAGVRQAGLDVR